MRKLIEGIVAFRRSVRPEYRARFAALATGQKPDALLFTCSDSRVAFNLFASTDPGDVFVVRSVGNLIPPAGPLGASVADQSEASAIEYAVDRLAVKNVIVCGHSSCGAMNALYDGFEDPRMPNLSAWLRHGKPALDKLRAGLSLDPSLPPADQLSQINVLTQLEHIQTYPLVREAVESRGFGIHGLWFDIGRADVYVYEPNARRFVILDEEEAKLTLQRVARA
jgi:carbonic anhydrase